MNRKILKHFFVDKIGMAITYFIAVFSIIVFFKLSTDSKLDIIYPILLSITIFVCYSAIAFYKYMAFDREINLAEKNPRYEMDVHTLEHKKVKAVIHSIHTYYINKINAMDYKNKQDNKLLAQWLHNMKTPLSVIDLILQKIEEEEEMDDHLINEMKQEKELLLKNLDQLLNIIRIKEFSKDYQSEKSDLYQSLKKVINERKSQFIYNIVYPEIKISSDEAFILTDPKWNEFILGQLISNAIKYSCTKGVSKKVYFNIHKKDKYTYLSIKDEGIGIPKHDLNKVFEAFYTGDNGRKYRNSTGIGLYLCKSICDKLGHDIQIKSKEKNGTEVTIKYLSKM